MTRTLRTIAALATTVAVALIGNAPATGSPPAPPDPELVATGLAGPLQLDVGHRGQIYVGQSFAGLLSRIGPSGNVVNLTSETASVEGVASRRWSVAYTTRAGDNPSNLVSELKLRKPDGTVRTIADLAAYEAARNPCLLYTSRRPTVCPGRSTARATGPGAAR